MPKSCTRVLSLKIDASVQALRSGRDLISPDRGTVGSEDGTARIWSVDGKCLKSIYHPGCVWAVTFLPNGDLVTACSDGIVRIFSEDENRLVVNHTLLDALLILADSGSSRREAEF